MGPFAVLSSRKPPHRRGGGFHILARGFWELRSAVAYAYNEDMNKHTALAYKVHARRLDTADLMRYIKTVRRAATSARIAGNGPALTDLLDELQIITEEFRSRSN